MWHLCTAVPVIVLIAETSYFVVYPRMPPIYAHEIFSKYDMYFLSGSYFSQILKVALLSISLSLEA